MSTPTDAPPREVAKRKRGRETVGDMIRSLGIVMIGVIALWWLAQPPSSDEAGLRPQDTAPAVSDLQRTAPGVPVPGALPEGFVANAVVADEDGLRIGWNTPTGNYLEYEAALVGGPAFLEEVTGRGSEVGTVDVGDVTWRQYQNAEEETTLVLDVDGRTVAVGGSREDTTLDEILELAAVTRP